MATRPIFIAEPSAQGRVQVRSVEFTWHAGMAMVRKQMSMKSLHEAAAEIFPDAKTLEVSRMSEEELGRQLSAFNLMLAIRHQGEKRMVPVECAFQAAKVFEGGRGPFTDLLDATPMEAKRDERLRNSGRLVGFRFAENEWPLEPLTSFYDWIYMRALQQHPELANATQAYSVFTDIAFNPKKSVNCQARAVALFVALSRSGKIEHALSSPEAFRDIEKTAFCDDHESGEQKSLF